MTEVVRDGVTALETVEVAVSETVAVEAVSATVVSAAFEVAVRDGSVSLEVAEAGRQGPQGPAGPQGPQGPIGDAGGAFLVANRLSELPDDTAKAAARINLQLQNIDCGEFL